MDRIFIIQQELKERKLIRRKDIRKMINKDELLYKLNTVIEYLKNNNGYNYKLYNQLCPDYEAPDSNIVEYAEDVLYMINLLIDNK